MGRDRKGGEGQRAALQGRDTGRCGRQQWALQPGPSTAACASMISCSALHLRGRAERSCAGQVAETPAAHLAVVAPIDERYVPGGHAVLARKRCLRPGHRRPAGGARSEALLAHAALCRRPALPNPCAHQLLAHAALLGSSAQRLATTMDVCRCVRGRPYGATRWPALQTTQLLCGAASEQAESSAPPLSREHPHSGSGCLARGWGWGGGVVGGGGVLRHDSRLKHLARPPSCTAS